MRKILFITIYFYNVLFCFSQVDSTRGIISKVVIDSLLISTNKPIYVKAEIDRLKFYKSTGCEYCESTDIALTIKDYNNKVLYKQNFPAFFDSWDYIHPSSLYLDGIGNVLVIAESHLPTVASDEGSIQIFGQNSYGYIIPMTGDIQMSGKFGDTLLFKVHKIDKSNVLKKVSDKCDDCRFCLETLNFTGWCGFSTGKYYSIDLQGLIDPNPIELDNVPIYAGVANYATVDRLSDDVNNRSVILYKGPDLKSPQKIIPLKINSIMKFFYILHNKDGSFIYLRLNGYEGYINDFSELDKLGFPACD